MNYFRQVLLRRGTTQQVVWIPDGLAMPGKHVRIKDVDGWLVVAAYRRETDAWLVSEGRDQRREFASLQ